MAGGARNVAGKACRATPYGFWIEDQGGFCDGAEVGVGLGITDQDVHLARQPDECRFERARFGAAV